jgi:hypothetical protein
MAETRNAMRAVVIDAYALPSCKETNAYVPDDTAVGAYLAAGP